ncbi:MAG TPA: hypothetical protein VMS08_05415 [Candidatus Saccharimonadia bacterium]|nr:hypothetical protein [Candidatus Saccharimonadia bacterium]
MLRIRNFTPSDAANANRSFPSPVQIFGSGWITVGLTPGTLKRKTEARHQQIAVELEHVIRQHFRLRAGMYVIMSLITGITLALGVSLVESARLWSWLPPVVTITGLALIGWQMWLALTFASCASSNPHTRSALHGARVGLVITIALLMLLTLSRAIGVQ